MFATGADVAGEVPAVAVGIVFDDPVLGALEGVERDAGPPSGPLLMPHVGVSPGPYHESFEPGKFPEIIYFHVGINVIYGGGL